MIPKGTGGATDGANVGGRKFLSLPSKPHTEVNYYGKENYRLY